MSATHEQPADLASLHADLTSEPPPRTLVVVELLHPERSAAPWLTEDPQLPRRVGAELAAVATNIGARAYRLDALLFALLAPPDPTAAMALPGVRAAFAAAGTDPAATLLHGEAQIPQDGVGADALAAALRRLHGRVRRHSSSANRQIRDVLLALLTERRSAGVPIGKPSVSAHAVAVGRQLGLSLDELDDIVRAAELQDLGKVALPQTILAKRGSLLPEEWEVVRQHPLIAERILSAAPALASAARLVRSCAERWDGSGYPDGLQGEAIPLGSRIISVCVAFDAMTSARPYREPMTAAAAIAELHRCRGEQFDPRVVAAFTAVAVELAYADGPLSSSPCTDSRTVVPA